MRSDHPSNNKRDRVCVYFKSSLPMQILNITMVHKCVNLEVRIDNKLWNLICLYRPPSQNMEEFETFVKNLELNLELVFTKDPYLNVVLVTLMLNQETGMKPIRPQLAGLNLKS